MSEQALLRLSLVLLMLTCAALVYLDWLRGGEIESIHGRLDAFGRAFETSNATRGATTVADVLHASSNGELDAKARENL